MLTIVVGGLVGAEREFGIGQYLMVGVATMLVLLVLWFVPYLMRLSHARRTLTYNVLGPPEEMVYAEFSAIMEANRLQVTDSTKGREPEGIRYIWRAHGRPADHDAAMMALMQDRSVRELTAL